MAGLGALAYGAVAAVTFCMALAELAARRRLAPHRIAGAGLAAVFWPLTAGLAATLAAGHRLRGIRASSAALGGRRPAA